MSDRAKFHPPDIPMNNFVRLGSLALALGLTGLLAGCASHANSVTQRPRMAHDFEVVETSTKRTLNDKEMAFLRAKVADYLDKQGATSSGNYYVKVYLGADQDGVPAEWVVVRFSRDMDLRFQLLGSDDSYYPGAQSYAAYDYYPEGYAGYSRLSFQYYDDPYYGGYYFPPQRMDNHDRDRNRNHDGEKNRGHAGDRNGKDDHSRPQDPPRITPGNQVAPPPQVTHARWDSDAPRRSNLPQDNAGQRHDGSSGRGQPDHSGERTYTPPSRTSNQLAPRNESPSYQPAPSQPSFRTSSQAAPSYSPSPARSESNSSSSSSSNSSSSSSQDSNSSSAHTRDRMQ